MNTSSDTHKPDTQWFSLTDGDQTAHVGILRAYLFDRPDIIAKGMERLIQESIIKGIVLDGSKPFRAQACAAPVKKAST